MVAGLTNDPTPSGIVGKEGQELSGAELYDLGSGASDEAEEQLGAAGEEGADLGNVGGASWPPWVP